MSAMDGQGLVSPSDIAELANVSRAAVSNWRKRAEDFPKPAGGTQAKPLFDRQAVESWLTARGHHLPQDHGESRSWAAMNTLRDALSADEAADLFLAVACARKLTLSARDLNVSWDEIVASAPAGEAQYLMKDLEESAHLRGLISFPDGVSVHGLHQVVAVVDTIEPKHLGEVADFILERLARAQVKAGADYGFVGSRTSELLANLAVSHSERQVIYDPACGFAIALVAAAQAGANTARLVGCDVNRRALQVARQRAFLHDVSIELDAANILVHDPMPELRADVVITEPPFGMRMHDANRMTDARYEFGTPPASSADTAWIQHAIAHLSDSGRAYVLTPHGPLFRGGQEQEIRMELVRRGYIEAIVGLPSKMLPQTSIPLALWVLRRPVPRGTADSILFIDASEEESPESTVPRWLASPKERPSDDCAEATITDVLAKSGLLTPNTWVIREETDPKSVIETFSNGLAQAKEVLEARESFEEVLKSPPKFSNSRLQSIGDLMREQLIDMRPGRSTSRYEDLPAELQQRVVTARDVQNGSIADFGELESSAKAKLPELTRPGDVLVTNIHTIRARVDETGGHLPGTGVYRLRVERPEILSPAYLAIAVTGNWNSHLMTGSTIQRAPVRDLEIPLLPVAEQEALTQVTTATQQIQAEAERLQLAAGQIREALLDAARLGIILSSEGNDMVVGNEQVP